MLTLFSLIKNALILGISLVGFGIVAVAELYVASILIEYLINNYAMDPEYSIFIYGLFVLHIIWMIFKFSIRYLIGIVKSLFR